MLDVWLVRRGERQQWKKLKEKEREGVHRNGDGWGDNETKISQNVTLETLTLVCACSNSSC